MTWTLVGSEAMKVAEGRTANPLLVGGMTVYSFCAAQEWAGCAYIISQDEVRVCFAVWSGR